jgi:nitrogen fixation protein NifB
MTASHPCFNPHHAASARRIHLPIVKSCNIQCRFCNRLYDCVNETRPGVSSAVLSPRQALAYLERMTEVMGPVDVAGIAGPGEAFSEPAATMETLELIHRRFPAMALCVASNGLEIGDYAGLLSKTGVTHASVTINTVDPSVGAKIIAWVRFRRKIYRGEEAASLLIGRQLEAVASLRKAGVIVKINTIVIPGINDTHVEAVAMESAGAGASVHNCIPFMPVGGSEFENRAAPDHDAMQKARWGASSHLPQVRHCVRCRADAAGMLGKDYPGAAAILRYFASQPLDPSQNRPYVAIASREGALVNEHLGRAERFYIYRRAEGGGVELCEIRPVPQSGSKGPLDRWRSLARLLHDCRVIAVSQFGESPGAVLAEEGISVVVADGLITEAVSAIFEGREVSRPVFSAPCPGPSNGRGCG